MDSTFQLIKPDINLPASVQTAHKVSLMLFHKFHEQVCPADENTLNLELNSLDNEQAVEPSIILQLREIKRWTGADCSWVSRLPRFANTVYQSFLEIM